MVLGCTDSSDNFYSEGSSWTPGNDACETCLCTDGDVKCMAIACSKPACPGAVLKDGTCCDWSCPGKWCLHEINEIDYY